MRVSPGTTTCAVAVICAQRSPNIVLVYEFYNSNLKHYFHTSSGAVQRFEPSLHEIAAHPGPQTEGWVYEGIAFCAIDS